MPDFCLPDLGEGLTEAEILNWRIKVGDRVATDQVVAEVETAKAAVELPVPFGGVVTVMHAEAGQVLPVGAPLITIEPSAQDRRAGLPLREPGVVTPDGHANGRAEAPRAESGPGSGSVLVGYGPSAGPGRRRRHIKGVPRAAADDVLPPGGGLGARPSPAGDRRVPVISPLVRRMAREAGIELATIAGTGPSGLVLRRDVELALGRPRPDTLPDPAANGASGGPVLKRIPLRGLRRTAAEKLSQSRREIPEATVWVDVDATELLSVRQLLNSRQPERPVSVLALIARFAVLGLRIYPELNSKLDHDEIVVPAGVQLGFAAQTPRGLVVPVVHDAHLLSARDLTAAISDLTAAARAGACSPADLVGGTFTVNNYGVFGVDGSAAIINYPEAAILGFGRIIDRPWIVDGQVAARKICQLSLVFDHRICDGGTAGGFLRLVADCIESPMSALGDL